MRHGLSMLLGALLVGTLGAPAAGEAQLLGKLKKRAEKEIEKAIDKPTTPPPRRDTIPARPTTTPATTTQKPDQPPSQVAQAGKVGEGAWANFDFVPGEKVLFFEDFTKDRVGNFPQRLELANGTMEVVEWNGGRWLRGSTTGAFHVKLPEKLPNRFTIEFDVTIPHAAFAIYTGSMKDQNPPTALNDRAIILVSQFYKAGVVGAKRMPMGIIYPSEVLPKTHFPGRYQPSQPVRVRVHADGKYVKVYLEEHRVANVPNADLLRDAQLVFHFAAKPDAPVFLTNLSINAGGRDMYDALLADGRVVTRGILFDTGSDRIRPESTPTLKEIGAMLRDHPELKLRIEGHTDAVGDDAANLSLSGRRAEAVKAYLVKDAQCDAARLETKGLGETKAVGSNDTAEGRQQNRRVELVKL